jgi:predicted O-methyltransferase YrrM
MKWIDQVFLAGQVAKGNIVRRKKTSVQRYSSIASLEAEVKRRGFHLVETGDQVIVICNNGSVKLRV